jgi:hypothetical protein
MRRLLVAAAAAAGMAASMVPDVARSAEAAPSADGEAALIRSAFERYRQAAMSDDGGAIVHLVSGASVAHYGRLREVAMASAGSEAALQRFVDRMQVQMLRKLVAAERLAGMSPSEVVAYAFENRMLGEDLESSSGLDRVVVEGDVATARHVARGRPVGAPWREVTFGFRREQDQWRLDLLHTLDVMEAQFHDVAATSGRKPEELAETIVGVFTGEAIAERLHSLVPSPAAAARVTPAKRAPVEAAAQVAPEGGE